MKKYYKCDVCEKPVENIAKIKTEGNWFWGGFFKGANPTIIVCERCFCDIVKELKTRKGLYPPKPPKNFKPAGHEVETR